MRSRAPWPRLLGVFVLSGGYNTAASSPHAKLVAWAVHTTMVNSVKRRAPEMRRTPPLSKARLLSGATEYEEHCVECHGGPGVARAHWVSAMLPTPPYLLDAGSRWTHGELYEIVNHGVKMTAMPAWGEVMSPQEVEDVVTFVELLPKISPSEYGLLRKAPQMSIARKDSTDSEAAPSGEAVVSGQLGEPG